jgi:cob(I)alamin adenosyltransferase
MPTYFTRNGDDGTTGLLGDERVPKNHLRPTTYGTLDEASAALGLARALSPSGETREIIMEVQRDLYKIMAEVAATPEEASRFRSIDADRITWLESQIEVIGEQVEMPTGFVLPGDSKGGAAIDLARTIVRRGERLIVQLEHEQGLDNPHLLPYLNRLSSLCFILALWENTQDGSTSISLANPKNP